MKELIGGKACLRQFRLKFKCINVFKLNLKQSIPNELAYGKGKTGIFLKSNTRNASKEEDKPCLFFKKSHETSKFISSSFL